MVAALFRNYCAIFQTTVEIIASKHDKYKIKINEKLNLLNLNL